MSKKEEQELKLGIELSKFEKIEKSGSKCDTYKWKSESGNPFLENLPIPKEQVRAYEDYSKRYCETALKEVSQMGIDDLKKTGSTAAVYSVPASTSLNGNKLEVFVNLDGEIVTGGFGKDRQVKKGLDIRVKLKNKTKSSLHPIIKELREKNDGK